MTEMWVTLFLILWVTSVLLLLCLAIYTEIKDKNPNSRHLQATGISLLITFILYPMTIAPTGSTSNGGALGLGLLLVATGLSWSAFLRNRNSKWVRRLVQLPIAALILFSAFHDAYCQYLSGYRLAF